VGKKIKKISLFFDRFRPFHETKEVGQIVLGLNDIGYESFLITEKKEILKNSQVPLLQEERKHLFSSEFWKNNDSEAVIFITHFHGIYTDVLKYAKESGKKVIIKADSDGRITFPVPPRFWIMLRPYPIPERAKNLLRFIKGIILYPRKISTIIRQVEIADIITFESPKAVENFRKILRFARREDLIKKVYLCPSPVADDVISSPLPKEKTDMIVSVANWKAFLQKNTYQIEKAVSYLLKKYKWEIKLVGDAQSNSPLFLGKKEHREVIELMSFAKINIVPSIYESFCLSAAESLCMGCTLVGTPIEVIDFYLSPGPCVVADGFLYKNIVKAVEKAMNWEIELYERRELAKLWRKKLSRRTIARQIINIIEQ